MTVVDAGPARRLVASYCFPPYSDTAAIVAAKRVRDRGEPVDVIFNAMDAIRRQDSEIVQIAGHLVRRSIAVRSKTAFSSWESIVDFQRLGLEAALRWERDQGAYESLYSRAQFAASHFLGAQMKLMRPDISWDAEFSDPLSHDVLGEVRSSPAEDDDFLARLRTGIRAAGFTPPKRLNALEWCEAVAFALADSIMFTNERQRDFMLERCHDPELAERAAKVAVVAPHPTLPREFYTLEDGGYDLEPGVRHIGYFGNFYANRGVAGVLDALGLLPRETRKLLRLHIFTSDVDRLNEAVESAGLEGSVRVNPFVGFLQFLALCDRMDCLLVNDAVSPPGGKNPFLPSKWSDYKGSTTKVWGIVEEGSPLDDHVLDYRSPIQHTTAAAQVLSQIATA